MWFLQHGDVASQVRYYLSKTNKLKDKNGKFSLELEKKKQQCLGIQVHLVQQLKLFTAQLKESAVPIDYVIMELPEMHNTVLHF